MSLREFSGAMGDFGTLIPLAAGYIIVCGLDPASLLITLGVATILSGLVFRLPVPIEPMKVLAVVAIAQAWSPSLVAAAGLAMGIIWTVLSASGLVALIARHTPTAVARGIQSALGVMLGLQAFNMLASWPLLGLAALVLAILLRNNRFAPAVLLLLLMGTALALGSDISLHGLQPGFSLPRPLAIKPADLWTAMILAGFAQLPLTATNSVISAALTFKTYWPDQEVAPEKLSWSIALLNLTLPFLGGIPLCHGAGGLAAKHFFGARTGGGNVAIGILEIIFGLFLAAPVALILLHFPEAIIGAMLLLISFEMIKFATLVPRGPAYITLGVTIVVSVLTNLAIGFVAGTVTDQLVRRFRPQDSPGR